MVLRRRKKRETTYTYYTLLFMQVFIMFVNQRYYHNVRTIFSLFMRYAHLRLYKMMTPFK